MDISDSVDIGRFSFEEAPKVYRQNRTAFTAGMDRTAGVVPTPDLIQSVQIKPGVVQFNFDMQLSNTVIRGFTVHTIDAVYNDKGTLLPFSLPAIFEQEEQVRDVLVSASERVSLFNARVSGESAQEFKKKCLINHVNMVKFETAVAVRAYKQQTAAAGNVELQAVPQRYIDVLGQYNAQGLTPGKEVGVKTTSKLAAIQRMISFASNTAKWSKYLPQREGLLAQYDRHYLASLDSKDGSPIIWFVFSLCSDAGATSKGRGRAMMLHIWMQSLLGIAMRYAHANQYRDDTYSEPGSVAAFALSFLCAEIAPRLFDPTTSSHLPFKAVFMQSLEGTDAVIASMNTYWLKNNKYAGPFIVEASEKVAIDGAFITAARTGWVDKLVLDHWVTDYWKEFRVAADGAGGGGGEEASNKRSRTECCISCGINSAAFAPNGNPKLGVYCGELCYESAV